MATWDQLGIHAKPLVLVNVDGYFDGFLAQIDRGVGDGLLKPEHRAMLEVVASVDEAFAALARWQAPTVAEVAAAPPPEALMQPLASMPAATRRAVRGVLADIDDTITTHGQLHAATPTRRSSAARGGQARRADHRPAGGLVRPHRAHVAGRCRGRRERRVLHALRRARRKLVKRFVADEARTRGQSRAAGGDRRGDPRRGARRRARVGPALPRDRPRDRLLRGRAAAAARGGRPHRRDDGGGGR